MPKYTQEQIEAYQTLQNTCGIKKGDIVEVIQKVETFPGWDNTWVSTMDHMIGKQYKVDRIYATGIQLAYGDMEFPFIALKMVNPKKLDCREAYERYQEEMIGTSYSFFRKGWMCAEDYYDIEN